MAEEQGFAQARARLDEIVVQVRKKDTSLEQSLDLLEEGVRLANQCTELVDHSEWRPSGEAVPSDVVEASASAEAGVAVEGRSDVELTARSQDTENVSAGTDAAVVDVETAEGVSDGDAGDEYDDIFADED